MKILVVVDMQNDFIDGALGTPEAQKIVPAVASAIRGFDGKILFTQDTHDEHYADSQEGRLLPVAHCIRNTPGWRIRPEIEALRTGSAIEKPSFGSVELGEMLRSYQEHESCQPLESITFVGLCTDICVVSNALIAKAFLPEVPVIVDASCCAGSTPENHRKALDTMKCCQIQVVNDEN